MKIFNIDNGWTIKLPENWKEERDEIDGYHIYYPTDSDLTIYPIVKHRIKLIKNDLKILVTVEELNENFNKSNKKKEVRNNTKVEGKKLNLNEFKIEEFKVECYEYNYYENNEKVYGVSCGIMVAGYLLIVNLYSALKEEVESAIKYIYSIEKVK